MNGEVMSRHFVFVYGSLRSGSARSMSLRFPESKFIADAKVKGSLYDLGPYPGLQLNESDSWVIGEVYEVDEELLQRLDEFESSSNYLRKQVEIPLGAQRMRCWTYEPDPDFYSLNAPIASGDWLEYASTKTDPPAGSTD